MQTSYIMCLCVCAVVVVWRKGGGGMAHPGIPERDAESGIGVIPLAIPHPFAIRKVRTVLVCGVFGISYQGYVKVVVVTLIM